MSSDFGREISELFEEVFGALAGKKRTKPRTDFKLRGDDVRLEQIEVRAGVYAMKVYLPNSQVITIPDGTKGQKYRYDSPTDGAPRIIHGAYLGGRCKIVVA